MLTPAVYRAFSGAGESPAAEQHGGTPDQKGQVPHSLVSGILADVVETQEDVIDDALDQVEGTPAHQQQTYQQ